MTVVDERLDGLSEAFFSELQRRFEFEPEKIPGTILPRLADFFTAYEDRKRAEAEREKALAEAAEANPLDMILVSGLPRKRMLEILMAYQKDLRYDLSCAEAAIQQIEQEAAGDAVQV